MVKEVYQFDFERLDVYQKALKFTNEIFTLTFKFRQDIQFSLGDQFRRAALSICNNLAEGSRKRAKSRKQFYGYSLDSARECIPMIEIAERQNQINSGQRDFLREECIVICKMVYRLSESLNT